MRIDACFDSHVHWPATGEFSNRLRLDTLKSPQDVRTLSVQPHQQRGEWIIGFGWDDFGWSEKPTRQALDTVFPDKPVAFTRNDAHASWVNTQALKLAGLWNQEKREIPGGRIERDADGWPTGILIDQAREIVEQKIPRLSAGEMRRHLLKGVKAFNLAGFTHIRDMTCDEVQWSEAVNLDDSGLLTLAVEEYFWLKDPSALNSMLDLAVKARDSQTANLRVKGLKIFLDGALGSEGAWLSRCYHGSDRHGVILWKPDELSEVFQKAWEKNLEVAVHVIGDAAADCAINVAQKLRAQGINGPLHLEHAELIRPDTLENMKGLTLSCHLQPVQWLSDQRWLKQKVGDLADHAFPWRRLQEAGIEFDFGSDSPIDPASVSRTLQALRESAEGGVPRLLGAATSHMSHRDLSWAPNSFTQIENENPKQVVFRGEHLL